MRFIISAIGAVLALGLVIPTPSVAQTAPQPSISQITNSCIDLARQRGWTESDLTSSRPDIRKFIARCVEGREARAQKQRPRR